MIRTPRDSCIIALYNSGCSLAELGEEFGLSNVGVMHLLERNGIPRRRAGRPTKRAA